MSKFPIITSVFVLALSFSSTVWATPKHHNSGTGSESYSQFCENAPPSAFDVNLSYGVGRVQFSVNISVLNFPSKQPCQQKVPFESAETQAHSNCAPVKIRPPMARPNKHDSQTDCGSQPPNKPKQPIAKPLPKPSKPVQQKVDFPEPQSPVEIAEYQCGEQVPLFEDYLNRRRQTLMLIKPNRHVYYDGDALQIELKFPKAVKETAVKDKAEAYLLVALPNGRFWKKPVAINQYQSGKWHKFIELNEKGLSNLAAGDYQIALVSTKPGGKHHKVNHWNHGFKGLLSTSRVKIASGFDADDVDGDGKIDCDDDGDGYCEEYSSDLRRRGIHFPRKPGCSQQDSIRPNRHVYYQGNHMQLRPKFEPESDNLNAVLDGNADAYALVVPPEGDIFVIPVPVSADSEQAPFFELPYLDTSNFAQGEYQIGLVLTKPGSEDAIDINNWNNGLSGLVSVTRIKITTDCDVEDIDGDGKIDDDTDEDGFPDVPVDEEEPVEPEPIEQEPIEPEPVDVPIDEPVVPEPIEPEPIEPEPIEPEPIEPEPVDVPIDEPVVPEPIEPEPIEPEPVEVPVDEPVVPEPVEPEPTEPEPVDEPDDESEDKNNNEGSDEGGYYGFEVD